MKFEDLPWLKPISDRLAAQLEQGTLPHALLISGPDYIGKRLLMENLVSRMLCGSGYRACGNCHQCQLLGAGNHPDYLLISPEDSKQIVIDQVRGLLDWVLQTSHQGGQKVCVINSAHCMNIQAANSLLKCLEEPPQATTIVLTSNAPSRLLPTIRSRCQQVVCHPPERQQAIIWLQRFHQSEMEPDLLLDISNGVPLRATEFIDANFLGLRGRIAESLPLAISGYNSPIQMAASFIGDDPNVVLDIMYHLTADSISHSLAETSCRNYDLSEHLEKLAALINLNHRFEFLNRLCRAKEMLGTNNNANSQMIFEWVLTV